MAPTYALGTHARLIGVSESTYGTAPDGAAGGVYTLLPFISTPFGQSRDLTPVTLLTGTKQENAPTYGAPNVAGDFRIPGDTRNLGWWLTHILGAPTTTGAGPYTHVWKSEAASIASCALEIGHAALATPDYTLFTGVRLGGFSFQTNRNAASELTVQAVGQKGVGAATPEDASPITRVPVLFKTAAVDLKIGAGVVGNPADVSFDFTTNLDINEGLTADGAIAGVEPSRPTCSGSFSLRYGVGAAAVRTQVASDLPFEMIVTQAAGAHSIEYRLAEVYLSEPAASIDGPGGVDVQHQWRAAYNTAAGYMLQVTLINDVATYP